MIHIGIAEYPDAQKAAIWGLKDLFEATGRYRSPIASPTGTMSVEIIQDFSNNHDGKFDAVILPPSFSARPQGDELKALSNWILRHHKRGALICSVCAGTFLLAASGLLDGRRATTHWGLAEIFSDEFPQVKLETERLVIDEGDVITAGGLMAWTDLGLKIIARFLGLSTMLETARLFLIDPGLREQSYYDLFSPSFTHGDDQILKVQHWLHAQYQSAVSVPQMANIAGQEERTFLRRFRAATGHTPSDYLQRLRINKARELLELTKESVETIASNVGYLDISAFRKLFQKIVGLSPSEYRRRFTPLESSPLRI
ncbi:GlxA family transcriptional regulator [Cohaesibacter gelatinilyticus]|uniref:Transcriptional regulator, AraC family with amidase-like domain n=1 Tax=Cohaesibacter gelatinilyticus TaxID=372072 RepID=A0A285PJZ4_9HYPH|nr:helix-turn-helix domain-containing protein [Cohaesibacter gelatinilyticus]SNZ21603.1 transcriptional regulator, AraC family with amidase-like domain [Cohaesibacter gelatinilyticus]